jgi:hypothetical protein
MPWNYTDELPTSGRCSCIGACDVLLPRDGEGQAPGGPLGQSI